MAIKKKTATKSASKSKAGKSPIAVVDGPSYHMTKVERGSITEYHGTIPVDDLVAYCASPRRADDPVRGFQRGLDEKRVDEIAAYLLEGLPVPGQVALSAQLGAHVDYNRGGKSLSFRRIEEAFLVLDGQHRLAAYAKANETVKQRVPVVIYEGLDRAIEARIFVDVNDKQRGVPPALLADVRALAGIESETDGKLRTLFDCVASDPKSALLGHTAPAGGVPGKLTRVTFNTAFRRILADPKTNMGEILAKDPVTASKMLVGYLRSWSSVLGTPAELIKPAMFGMAAAVMEDVLVAAAKRGGGRPTEAAQREVIAANVGAIEPREGVRRTKVGMIDDMRTALRGKVQNMAAAVDDDAEAAE